MRFTFTRYQQYNTIAHKKDPHQDRLKAKSDQTSLKAVEALLRTAIRRKCHVLLQGGMLSNPVHQYVDED